MFAQYENTSEEKKKTEPVDKDIVVSELKNEGDQLLLYLQSGVVVGPGIRLKDGNRVDGLAIHLEGKSKRPITLTGSNLI